jgi:integrase
MKRPEFGSIFKSEINAYLDAKVAVGYQERSFTIRLRVFDNFCKQNGLNAPVFTKELADEWYKKRKDEATTTHYSRINEVKHFLSYLQKRGYDVYVTRDISFKKTQFQPHIYTTDETARYFRAVDAFESGKNKKCALQYPILFRLLYCCGSRIDETLRIRKKDVDLEEGIIRLIVTKNNRERFIVLEDSLTLLMRRYADKCFYLLGDEDYIFTSSNGGRCQYDTIYDHHRLFLKSADIPYIGNSEGPRIHDWRHTFAVNSFKQMVDAGIDMYVALPILSTYLGHKTILATESYVRLTMAMFPYIEEKFKSKLDEVFGCGVMSYEAN